MTFSVLRHLGALLLLLAAVNGVAAELQRFSSEELRERYMSLIDDLRCPQCQNQNISDSDSPIAQDLRRAVLRMLEKGSTDGEIIDYLIDRYGDFIIYMPRFKPETYALWLLPGGLAIAGVLLIVLIVRRKRGVTGTDGNARSESGLSGEERERLSALLSEPAAGADSKGHK